MTKRRRLNLQRLESLARWLEIPLSTLQHVASNVDRYYKPKDIPKRGGGLRHIDRPVGLLKEIQAKITAKLLRALEVSSIAIGGIPGVSHVDTVWRHTRKACVANLDIEAFFPSTTNQHVYSMWNRLGCSPDVSRLLTLLTTYDGHLPQGSPASTDIVNVMLFDFDEALDAFARGRGVEVSRYIDDITLSGDHEPVCDALHEAIAGLRRLGFSVQRRKLTITSSGSPQTVLGLRVNRTVSVPAHYRGATRAAIGKARESGMTLEESRRLVGRIQYISGLHPAEAARLRALLDEVHVRASD